LVSNDAVNRAFSRQSGNYDHEDEANIILQDMRKQVYSHLVKFLQPKSHILELNAGTGIDALHLISQGHTVHAIDISEGMIRQVEEKIEKFRLNEQLTCERLSYEDLDRLHGSRFDYVFSDFGGLNCIDDLSRVTAHLPKLLKPGAKVTWVVMPPVCPWELLAVFKGKPSHAFRRFHKNGVVAHLEGEYFKTYYHSLSKVKAAFGPSFSFLKSEGLAALSPQPHSVSLPTRYPHLYKNLRKADAFVRTTFPFNRWADHLIVTFAYNPRP
jgi:ubiquinone/menaquinone biosynthesis C-methylase UbiE